MTATKAPKKVRASRSTQRPASTARTASTDGSEIWPAYLLSLKLSNVRCFGPEQTLNLSRPDGKPARWTVILGNNGVGKTTLLEALALMLPEQKRYSDGDLGATSPLGYTFPVPRRWFRYSQNHFELVVGLSWSNTLEGEICKDSITKQGLSAGADDPFPTYSSTYANQTHGTVVYAYGASRRPGEPSLSDEQNRNTISTLFSNNATLRNPEEWWLQTDFTAAKESPHQQRAKRQLARVKDVLVRVLPDVHDVRVVTSERRGGLVKQVAEVKTDDGWIPMSALGLGYRTMTAWMVDFASRLMERYSDLTDPLAGPAVCLVDEIDLHLHPRWQRELISHLSQLFPQTQFVVTAHSPLVVQAATDANLVILRREGDHVVIDQHSGSVRSWRLDQILTSELFELPSARAPDLDQPIRERNALLAKPRLTATDEKRLAELRRQLADLPTGETSEDIEAMDLIRRAAVALRAPKK
ncbi:MAG: AAA family ATPase [Myxococcales bacterium]|nr:AAA family ATPase [Myxococcales bacterium]